MLELRRFDLNLLISLDALLHEKNISRAAEKLHVSQPAMSAALHKLREYFNDTLLVRVGRNLELTPRGQSLVEPVREALLRIQATLGTHPQFDPATARREFTIIISEEALPDLLPALLKRVTVEAPGISCRVQLISESILTRLEYGEADLCVCLDSLRLYAARAWPDSLHMVRLRPVRWICAVDAHHPTVGNALSAEQFFALPHAFAAPSGYSVSSEELVRRLFDVDLTVHLAVPSLLHLPLVLAGTPYVATMPERVLRLAPAVSPLKSFPTPFPVSTQHELLLWHKRHEPDPAHAWLRELIVQITRGLS
ncbi:MAG TPA: LysR family transcriptional regulator [Steroidobacteraceae bacterium]|nr:LysR family transcriptional regulator [Steroidobacteraceae bacterium]